MKGRDELEVSSVGDFLAALKIFVDKEDRFKCYRGQYDASWDKCPSLLRSSNKKILDDEANVIRKFIATYPQEFSGDNTMFDRLVRMQHFGLPTRLLDVSKNPLVALYFATTDIESTIKVPGTVTCFAVPKAREKFYDSDSICCMSNLSNLTCEDRVQVVEAMKPLIGLSYEKFIEEYNKDKSVKKLLAFALSEKPYVLSFISHKEILFPSYVHAKLSNPRIVAQAGGFIMYGVQYHEVDHEDKIVHRNIIIPASAKENIRRDLAMLGITESFLFPELERKARDLRDEYAS